MTTKTEVPVAMITPATEGKWKLEGYDTFEGGPDAYYPIEGEYDSQAEAEAAASKQLQNLEKSQPSSSSGGQTFQGIQDRIYTVSPDGTRRRFIG